jgi:hypothetical protein
MLADLTLAVLSQRISSSFSGPGEDCVAEHCVAAASEAPAAMRSQNWRPQLLAYDQLPTIARVDRRLLHGCQHSVEAIAVFGNGKGERSGSVHRQRAGTAQLPASTAELSTPVARA